MAGVRATIGGGRPGIRIRNRSRGSLAFQKSKRIPSIFNDESTGSFICLRRHIYISHVNKVQLIRVKMICIAVIRAFQPIVVQKMWMLAVVLTTYVSFCIV
jgi:hypothetical protein